MSEVYKVGDRVKVLSNSLEEFHPEANQYIGMTGVIAEVIKYSWIPGRIEYDVAINGYPCDGEWSFNPAFDHKDLVVLSKRKTKEKI